jgi:hypothetical protein
MGKSAISSATTAGTTRSSRCATCSRATRWTSQPGRVDEVVRVADEAGLRAELPLLPRDAADGPPGPELRRPKEVSPTTCRFVHIDASHLYEHVHGDIGAAQDILLPGGIVVLDDFRSEHTPGVSVAAWEAVLNRGLRPICLSTQKLYGTWGDPEPLQDELLAMIKEREDFGLSVQQAAGHRIDPTRSKKGMQAPPFPPSRLRGARPEAPVAPPPRPAPRPARSRTAVSPRPAAPDRTPPSRRDVRAADPHAARSATASAGPVPRLDPRDHQVSPSSKCRP